MRHSFKIIFLTFLQIILCSSIHLSTEMSEPLRPNRNSNICRYREVPYPETIFAIHASNGCYGYTRGDMFVGGEIERRLCPMYNDDDNQTIFRVPGIMVNENCIPFSHTSNEIIQNVMSSFQNELIVQRWINCSEDALACCKNVLHEYNDEGNSCPPTWDAWACYEKVLVGSNIKKQCPSYSYIAHPPRCLHYSYKECFENATWNTHTDYSTCSITPRLIVRTNWHTAMLSMSIIVATPAIVLLICYRGQQLQRLNLIRNLIIAIVTRNTLVLISKQVIIMDELTSSTSSNETIMGLNEWPCKVLAFSEKLATNSVFACMLLEGIFLHQLLTNVFASRRQSRPTMLGYYIGAFGISIIAAISWACVMALKADEYCWLVTDTNNFDWINGAPKLFMLITCTVLLCHIIFNVWTAFKNQNDVQHSAIRTAKVSILCMPLFGIPFLFFIGIPDTDYCAAEQVYYFFSYAFEGLQGLFVAILHCYSDKEILRFYNPIFRDHLARIKCINKGRSQRESHQSVTDRKDTMCTVVDGNDRLDSTTTEI